MIDFAKITVKAGDGGRGAGSFVHVKSKRRGKADGGDGGRGGDVYFAVWANINTLERFRFVKEYKAEDGQPGASNRRKGAEGQDLVVRVPQGTLIKKNDDEQTLLFDLSGPDDKVLVARGGEYGRGNMHMRDEFGRRPLVGELGDIGEDFDLILELKTIADVGLIGLPNAGKSTLLSKLTAAKPKIADYPFTTLEPNLGALNSSLYIVHGSLGKKNLVPYEQSTIDHKRILIADMPGLIAGASEGVGLGVQFLRHIERTKVLVHLVAFDSPEVVWENYSQIRTEISNYSRDLATKAEIIVISKIDLATENGLDKIKAKFKEKRKKVYLISSTTGAGVSTLLNEIDKRVIDN